MKRKPLIAALTSALGIAAVATAHADGSPANGIAASVKAVEFIGMAAPVTPAERANA